MRDIKTARQIICRLRNKRVSNKGKSSSNRCLNKGKLHLLALINRCQILMRAHQLTKATRMNLELKFPVLKTKANMQMLKAFNRSLKRNPR
jgi:hypothetical protein